MLIAIVPAIIGFIALQKRSLQDLLHSSDTMFIVPYFAIMVLAAIYLLLVSLAVLRQVFFRSNEAIWIENGNLIYLHPFILSIATASIKNVSVKAKQVSLELKSGKKSLLPARSLRESADEIARTLQELLT